MKKLLKFGFVIIACLIVLFLLLPFMVPETGLKTGSNAQEAAQQAATPQIFTSNPLSKLVNAIARLFGQGQAPATAEQENAPLTEAQAKARFGAVIPQKEYKPTPAGGNKTAKEKNDPEPPATQTPNEQADFSDLGEGEWMLAPQTAPESSIGGMHEINVNENAYDRYVKYERAARFTPTTADERPKDVPDSKIARFFRPIKRFFGFGNGTPAQQGTPMADATASAGHATRTGDSEPFGQDYYGSNLPSGGAAFAPNVNFPHGDNGKGGPATRESTKALLNSLYPTNAITRAAQLVADAKYPNPTTPEEIQAKEEFKENKIKEYIEFANAKLKQQLKNAAAEEQKNMEGESSFDMITKVIQSCTGARGSFITPQTDCEDTAPKPLQESEGAVNAARRQHQEEIREEIQQKVSGETYDFIQKMGEMPSAPVTVILSKADTENTLAALQALQQLQQETDEAQSEEEKKEQKANLLTIQKYRFMLETKCQGNPCYWVATGEGDESGSAKFKDDAMPLVQNTIWATGLELSTHDAQRKALDDGFAQQQAKQGETKNQNGEEIPPVKTPYIVLTLDELKEIQEANKKLVVETAQQGKNVTAAQINENLGKTSALFTSSATTAEALSEDLNGEAYIFYGTGNNLLMGGTDRTFKERSDDGAGYLKASIDTVANLAHELKEKAAQESVSTTTQAAKKPQAAKTTTATPKKAAATAKTVTAQGKTGTAAPLASATGSASRETAAQKAEKEREDFLKFFEERRKGASKKP